MSLPKRALCTLIIISIIAALSGCNQKRQNTDNGSETMSKNFVYADDIGVQPGDKECTDKVNKALNEGKSIYFNNGDYYFSGTIKLKNGQICGNGTNATKLIYTGNESLIEADGSFCVSDLTLCVDTANLTCKEKSGESVLIKLGANGGVKEGSVISKVSFADCGTAVYESKDATASRGLTIDTTEISNVTYAGLEFMSSGRTGNKIQNMYIGRIGDALRDVSFAGIYFGGSETDLEIEQLNIEHFKAEHSVVFDGIKNLKVSTIHIEGMDIAKQGEGYVNVNNTSGVIDALTVYWSRVSYNNSSCILLGDSHDEGDELTVHMLQFKGVNDPAGFHGDWPVRGIKDNGFKIIDRKKDAKNKYSMIVDSYIYFSYQNDLETLASFPCDDANIIFMKKGDIPVSGPTEKRPTQRLCKGYSKYYDTTIDQLLTYNGDSWE